MRRAGMGREADQHHRESETALMPARWYVVIMTALGAVGLLCGIGDHSESEMLRSLIPFGMAAFGYVIYVRRWHR